MVRFIAVSVNTPGKPHKKGKYSGFIDLALPAALRWALTHNPVRNVPDSVRYIDLERALEIAKQTTGVSLDPPNGDLQLQLDDLDLGPIQVRRLTNVHNPNELGETLICYPDFGMNPDDAGLNNRIENIYALLEANNVKVAQILILPTPGYGGWQYMNLPESLRAATGNRLPLSNLILKQLLEAGIIDHSKDLTFFGYSQGGAFAYALAKAMNQLDSEFTTDSTGIGRRTCICLDPPGLNKQNPFHQLFWLAVVEARQLDAYEGPGANRSVIELIVDQIKQSGISQSIAGLALVGSGLGYGGPRFETSDEINETKEFARAYNLKMGRAPNSSIFPAHAYRCLREVLGQQHVHSLEDAGTPHSHAVARNPFVVASWTVACRLSGPQEPRQSAPAEPEGGRFAGNLLEYCLERFR